MTPHEPSSALARPSPSSPQRVPPDESSAARLASPSARPVSNSLVRDVPIIMMVGLRVADLLIIMGAGWLAYVLGHKEMALPHNHLALVGLASLVTVQLLETFDAYRSDDLPVLLPKLRRVLLVWSLAVLMALTLLFFLQLTEEFSRLWIASWWGLAYAGMALVRVGLGVVQHRARRAGLLTRRVAIVGAGDIGQWLLNRLQASRSEPVEVVGVFDDRMQRLEQDGSTLPIMGTVADMIAFLRSNDVDMVVIALPSQAVDRLEHLVRAIRVLPVEVHVCPGRIGFNLERSEVVSLSGVPLLKVASRPLDKGGWLVKRAADCVLASLITLMIAPLLVMIAIAIAVDSPGPILFLQRRIGFNGIPFTMFKFRSMRVATAEEAAAVRQAQPGDDRITRVGRILRRYSLDELPQFFNVLIGNMSVVGPRPHAERHDQIFAQYIGDYPMRARVKPGITGWAQVNGFRGLTDTEESIRRRVEYDLWYIENWSLALDLQIILMTIFGGMTGKNAF